MINTVIRFILTGVVLGIVYGLLRVAPDLTPTQLAAFSTAIQGARGLDRILPVHEALDALNFEINMTLLFIPVFIVLKIRKWGAPNA